MDTIQCLDALGEEHSPHLIELPMTKASVAHPKRIHRPSIRHRLREPNTDCHRGDAHALERKNAVWRPKVVDEEASQGAAVAHPSGRGRSFESTT
jgi:hypothetical protein